MSDRTLVVQLAIDVVILGAFLLIAIVNGTALAWALFGLLVFVAMWGLG